MYYLKIQNISRDELQALTEKISEALAASDESILDVSIPLLDFFPPIRFVIFSDKEGMK